MYLAQCGRFAAVVNTPLLVLPARQSPRRRAVDDVVLIFCDGISSACDISPVEAIVESF